jgi:mannosyltransferase OCH1-like enzyme
MPKISNLTLSPIASEIEDSLQNLPEDIREECIMAIKNKRNNQYHNNYRGNYWGNNNNNQNTSKNRQIDCRSRLCQNKPLTWKNKEAKSKFHSNKIV